MVWLTLCATILLSAYLLGSTPTGYTAARLLKGIDIREHGSGSTGATNVLRTLGKGPGLLVLLVDMFKGVLALALVHWMFTGGKSVATSLGVLLAMNWQVAASTVGVFSFVLALSRIVSLSSIAGAIAVSLLMLLLHQPLPYVLFGVAGGLYVILRHRSNIQRLLAGEEPRLGQKITGEAEQSVE
jgi:glycerol-3-phosphate acyltransferase PlsY